MVQFYLDSLEMLEKSTVNRFKRVMIEMYRGYPDYVFYGVLEDEFGKDRASRMINLLKDDGLIIFGLNEKGFPSYKLTKKGVDFAIAMANLDFSQKTHYFTEILIWFTRILVVATIGMLVFGFAQAIISLWF